MNLSSRRLNLGIFYSYNEDWIGGVYYIENIVKSLKILPLTYQPLITVICESYTDFEKFSQNTGYENLVFQTLKRSRFSRLLDTIFSFFSLPPIYTWRIDKFYLFKIHEVLKYVDQKKKIFWMGDLQNHFFPSFFDSDSLNKRFAYQKYISNCNHVVASSIDMKLCFKRLYPNYKCNLSVLNFTSILNESQQNNETSLLLKYDLVGIKYFYVPNQFWAHKNHSIVFKAVHLLKEKGEVDFKIVFSGREFDRRNPDYFVNLKNEIKSFSLESFCVFLGFIPREDQIVVYKNAIAVIQPSLYEGWSTVIEDAKALNISIICSSLDVHKEQLGDSGNYFDPFNTHELVYLLESNRNLKKNISDYSQNIYESALQFYNIIKY